VLPAIGTQQKADQCDVARVHCLQRNAGIRAIEIGLCHEFLRKQKQENNENHKPDFNICIVFLFLLSL
jgi:hypothetical protein